MTSFQMRDLQIQRAGDIPGDFLQKLCFEPGVEFMAFLSRLKGNGLSFVLEFPDDAPGGAPVLDAINEQVEAIMVRGGPSLPGPTGIVPAQATSRWEFLSCKYVKMKERDLRLPNSRASSQSRDLVRISASTKMLSPVEHKVRLIAREFGFKDPLRVHDDEPEKFVIIGGWVY